MKQQRLFVMMLVLVASLFFYNCSNETSNSARVQVLLVDAPGDYEEVNIDLKDILINRTGEEAGWESIGNVQQGTYNLLEFTGGSEALIADSEIPAGEIKQIHLLLGPENTLVLKGGETVKLDTPSALQSGLKLKFNTTLVGGITYTIILDFDADKSIVKAGNSGKYNLKPVIRVNTEAASGAITGKVTFPTGVTSLKVTATNVNDTSILISTQTDEFGKFMLKGVLPGNYNLTFEKSVESVLTQITPTTPVSLNPIIVTLGTVTDVGIITF